MKLYNKKYITALAITLIAAGGSKLNSQENTSQKSLEFEYMDTTVSPRVDFYEFAAGTWVANNPVPSTESKWSSFNELADENSKKLKALLEECASKDFAKGSPQQLIGDYYASILDSNKRNALGMEPLLPYLKEIQSMASTKDLSAYWANMHKIGVSGGVSFYIYTDLKDNSKYVSYLGQTSLGLPDKDFYFKEDDNSKKIMEAYKLHVTKMFSLLGYSQEESKAQMEKVLDLEMKLASSSMNRVEQRDYTKLYNVKSYAQLKEMTPNFDWDVYFSEAGMPAQEEVVVSQLQYVTDFNKYLAEVDLSVWKAYLTWNLVNTAASYLSDEFEQADFDFYQGVLGGKKSMKPRWERAISAMNWTMGEPMGRVFVEKHFTPEAKEKVEEMVDNIIAAFDERLDQLDWMSDSTKQQAKIKLSSFTRKLGYPEVWKDMSSMNIVKDNFLNNRFEASKYEWGEMIKKYGSEVDKTEWGMPAHIVNAYYSPSQNEIVFPAGIMQAPFFDPEAEDAVNYARMGAVIGHELTHGFDDQGAQFNAEGNFINWWTEADMEKFNERTQKLKEQFDSYEPLQDEHIDGQMTLGENIADLGGLTIAYYAYQKSLEGKERTIINGYTPEQRFFIAFAQVWKSNYTEEAMLQQLRTNVHSPGKYRVIGTLSNMPEFFEAFNVVPGDPMRQPDELIARIW